MPGPDEDLTYFTPESELQPARHEPTPSTPGVDDSGRPKRVIRLPLRYRDVAPPSAIELEDPPSPSPPVDSCTSHIPPPLSPPYLSKTNAFGIFHQYARKPAPDELRADAIPGSEDTEQEPGASGPLSSKDFDEAMRKALHPFPNYSTFLFLLHDYDGISKSRENRQRQIRDVFLNPHFRFEEFITYAERFERFEAALDAMDLDTEDRLGPPDAWHTTTLTIILPIAKARGSLDRGIRHIPVEIPGLQHRSITAVVVEALKRKRAPHEALHYVPYRQFWKNSTAGGEDITERVVDDLYTSDAWLMEDARVQRLTIRSKNGVPCLLPRALAGLMFWSDATQLASFGSAKLWPLYMFLGNQAKWHRSKPRAACCHHIAYLPSVCEVRLSPLFVIIDIQPASRFNSRRDQAPYTRRTCC